MNVYNRKLFFNRGGRVSARGTGITSGLDTPKRGYVDGPGSYQGNGEEALPGSDLQKSYSEYLDVINNIRSKREPTSKFELLAPAALTFFGKLMSGKSYQSGLGGALDIAGESLTAATPQLEAALQSKRAMKESRLDADEAAKLKALDMAYDDLAAEKTLAGKKSYSTNKYEVRMKDAPEGQTSVATEYFNKADPSGTYYEINGEIVSAEEFDILGTLGQRTDETAKQNFERQDYKVTLNNGSVVTLTKIRDKTKADAGVWYDSSGAEFDASKIKSVEGTLGAATETAAKQNYTRQDYKVTLNDGSVVTLTKVTDKTKPDAGVWQDANGNDFDSSKIKSVDGTLGAAKEADAPKKRTPSFDTFYDSNPKWQEGQDVTGKYLQIATKIDEDNKVFHKDSNTGQYISADSWFQTYGTIPVSDQPLDWKPRIEAGIDVASDTTETIKQKKVFTDRFNTLYADSGYNLNEADLDFLLSAFPPGSDFIKTLQTGQVNELDGELFKLFKQKDKVNQANLTDAKSDTHSDGTAKSAVDKYYNLDNQNPNYETRYPYYVQKYNQIPMMSDKDITAVTESIQNLKDLSVIFEKVEEAIPLLGGPVAVFSEIFGVNEGLIEFVTAKRGLEATSIEQLVSGVPSNFDAERIIATLPQERLSPATNKIRIKRLKQIFGDLILNKIKHNIQLGKRVPADMVMLARELGDTKKIDQILKGEVDQERVEFLNNISAGSNPEIYNKDEYIKKFGDSFSRSISLLDKTDVSLNEVLSKEEKQHFEDLKKKYKGNN
jgi:hypothetical protein